jgi:CMP-N,N'-diacetyllegionaminic acid synthase
MAKIVALIPARSGSKGVPHKNIRELGGRLVLEWSIAACLKSSLIEKTIVSTDSEQYAILARKFGATAPFLRPPEISADHSSDFDFINHALGWLELNEELPNYIVHIRPTTPFRKPDLIDQAIKYFIERPYATALRSVHIMPESAYKTFQIAETGELIRVCSGSKELDAANNARQSFPDTYVANGYVDVLSVDFIRSNRLLHGDHVIPFVTPVVDEIDTEDCMTWLQYLLSKNPELFLNVFDHF